MKKPNLNGAIMAMGSTLGEITMKPYLLMGFLYFVSAPSFSTETEGLLMSCLKHWGNAPFNEKSPFTLLANTVKVFGIGQDIEDLLPTPQPKLYLVDAGPNIMGSSTIQLLNPNGYYCFKNNVNVMGGMTIQAHCHAHLASAGEGVTFGGKDSTAKSVTVFGATHLDLVGCIK